MRDELVEAVQVAERKHRISPIVRMGMKLNDRGVCVPCLLDDSGANVVRKRHVKCRLNIEITWRHEIDIPWSEHHAIASWLGFGEEERHLFDRPLKQVRPHRELSLLG